MKNFALYCVFFVLATTNIACAQDKPSSTDNNSEFIEILPGVHVRFGTHRAISAESVANIANHGFVVGEQSVAIVDPGGSRASTEKTLEAIKSVTDLPISHVIVTHVHPDHSMGLAAFADEQTTNPTIYGHPALANSLLHNLDFFAENFADTVSTQLLYQMIESGRITPVTAQTTIDLGNRQLILTSFDIAHTATDLTVFDTTSNSLWTGDLLFVERLPSLDGSLRGWLAALTQMDNMQPETVIPGHGTSGPWAQKVKPQRTYLQALLDTTRQAIKDGQSLKRFIDSNVLTNNQKLWALFDNQHRTNLTRAYTELEWE